jgi:hypothetical protein
VPTKSLGGVGGLGVLDEQRQTRAKDDKNTSAAALSPFVTNNQQLTTDY